MIKTKENVCGAAAIVILLALFVSPVHAGVLYGLAWGGNRDYVGGDYVNSKVKNLDECIKKCAKDKRCKAFAYADPAKACTLKDQVGKEVRSPGMMAGHKL